MHAQETSPRRPYRMGRRRDSIESTRDRITAATFELHATIGPSRTTISGIAERAGVQRHTVYAHFPDLGALFLACTAHGMRVTGMPAADPWLTIPDARERLRHGLADLYRWYRSNEVMLRHVLFDPGPGLPATSEADPFETRMAVLTDALRIAWTVRPERRVTIDAAIAHAMAFTTWDTLTGSGLDDASAVELMTGLAVAVAAGTLPGGA